MNITLVIISLIIAIIFVLIYFLAIHPINKITKYAIEATQGKINKKINIGSNDEYKDLSNALFYLTSELNNIDEYQRKFISNISHDFRSPLTSIKGYLEAMLDGTIPPENYEKYIKTILFESERLTELTTNLLTLNQLDNTKQILNKTNFDVNYIIKKTIDVYEGRCTKNKITLETNFESTTLLVYADQAKIQQVINNILDNAIKFSPHNSSIVLSTYVKSEKAFISIKDYGQGIPKESISHIWERFYKTDASRGKDKKGTGLGLAITKDIINAHQENINVTNTVGVGTEFCFSLPKSKNNN
jgi:signal transduction histidine kinase